MTASQEISASRRLHELELRTGVTAVRDNGRVRHVRQRVLLIDTACQA